MALSERELSESYAILHRVFPDDLHIARPYVQMLQQHGHLERARDTALTQAERMLAGGNASYALGFLAICRQLNHPDRDRIESLSGMARFAHTDSPEQSDHTFALIEQLSDSEALDFITQGKRISAAAGDHVVTQGEQSRTFYLILDGELNVEIALADGPGRVVKRLMPGDFFGEFACLYKLPRSASVTAATTAHLLEFSDRAIERLMRDAPMAGEYLIRTVQQRMIHAMTHTLPAFSELPEADHNWVAEESAVREFQSGETIDVAKETQSCCAIVLNGSLCLNRADGSTLQLQTGAMFGALSPHLQLPEQTTLVAGAYTLLCKLPEHIFHAFINVYTSFDQQVHISGAELHQK